MVAPPSAASTSASRSKFSSRRNVWRVGSRSVWIVGECPGMVGFAGPEGSSGTGEYDAGVMSKGATCVGFSGEGDEGEGGAAGGGASGEASDSTGGAGRWPWGSDILKLKRKSRVVR